MAAAFATFAREKGIRATKPVKVEVAGDKASLTIVQARESDDVYQKAIAIVPMVKVGGKWQVAADASQGTVDYSPARLPMLQATLAQLFLKAFKAISPRSGSLIVFEGDQAKIYRDRNKNGAYDGGDVLVETVKLRGARVVKAPKYISCPGAFLDFAEDVDAKAFRKNFLADRPDLKQCDLALKLGADHTVLIDLGQDSVEKMYVFREDPSGRKEHESARPMPRSGEPRAREDAHGWTRADAALEQRYVYDFSDPKRTVLSYVVAFNKGDAETMYNRLCSSGRRRTWDSRYGALADRSRWNELRPDERMIQETMPARLRGLMGRTRWEYTSCVRGPILRYRITQERRLSPSKVEIKVETVQRVPDNKVLRAFRSQQNEYIRHLQARGLSHSSNALDQYLRTKGTSDEVELFSYVARHGRLPDRLPGAFEGEEKSVSTLGFVLEAGEWKWDTGKL